MRQLSHSSRRAGFTLVESLLVMAIITILLVLVAGGVRTVRENMHLTSAGQLLADEIGRARQFACAHNGTVLIYLFKVPSVSPSGYSALQLWRSTPPDHQNNGTALLPVDKPCFLPGNVVISEDATHNSTFLALLAAQPGRPPALSGLPPSLVGADYVAFAIQPSGRLMLDGDQTTASALAACCLTVVPARFGGQSATPTNFVTLQINPNTGASLIHRP